MKLSFAITLLCATVSFVDSRHFAYEYLPPPSSDSLHDRDLALSSRAWRVGDLTYSRLEKRRGGGGGGGGGGKGGGGSGGGVSSSSGRSSSSGSSGSRAGTSGANSVGSIAGGKTRSGSGAPARFAGGKFYGGGSSVPFTSGRRSPNGLAPLILPLAFAAAIFPGLWLYSVFSYQYNTPYYYRNVTRPSNDDDRDLFRRQVTSDNGTDTTGTVQVLPVYCLCQEFSVCGCDDNQDTSFLNELLPNGTAQPQLNESLIRISDVNGTRSIVLNGTLPNGTTAPGGENDATSAGIRQAALENAGWWVAAAVVGATVWMI